MAEAYTEVIRNIPLLLQVLFWYLAILPPLPGLRLAMHFNEIMFPCNRGLQIPKPILEPGFMATPLTFLAAVILSIAYVSGASEDSSRPDAVFPITRSPSLFSSVCRLSP
jgi:general L-amino acid transport system permease protein